MKQSGVPSAAALATLFVPAAAQATGAEMGPMGGALLMMGGAAAVVLQALTLFVAGRLPARWPRLWRWLIALGMPWVIVLAGWLTLAWM